MPVQQEISGHLHPVKVWASRVEEQALRQLGNVADLPIIHHHVAAMRIAASARRWALIPAD